MSQTSLIVFSSANVVSCDGDYMRLPLKISPSPTQQKVLLLVFLMPLGFLQVLSHRLKMCPVADQ